VHLSQVAFSSLDGFETDHIAEIFVLFRQMAVHVLSSKDSLRAACPPSPELRAVYQKALEVGDLADAPARAFFKTYFQPFRIDADPSGFVTGYYEPEVEGALQPGAGFTAPILARPADLVTLNEMREGLMALRRLFNGDLVPYPTRAEIENGHVAGLQPLVFLRDAVEVFLIQVQGSARVRLPDGRVLRLRYDGRNGHPYISIGRKLIEAGEITEAEMSLARLKEWLRSHGLAAGGRARALMHTNRSYIFFTCDEVLTETQGPIGGAGLSLQPLRSLAIDRSIWSYGLPFWIEAELPFQQKVPERFARLMLAHDTGSAIVGAARGDIFFGTGEKAGYHAGNIRHAAQFTVLLPKP